MLTKDDPTDSDNFIQLSTSLMNFSDLPSTLERLEFEEKKEVDFEWIWKEPANLITPYSLLIDVKNHWKHFKTWFDGQDFELKLLYRGSE